MIDDLIAPVVVPDIDEGVMSYRAALVGSNDVTKQENKPPISETKVSNF